MSLEFLAMVIILLLLIVFVVLVLSNLASSAGVRIRTDMVALLSSYDTIIDQKSAEIARLSAEQQKLDDACHPLPPPVSGLNSPASRTASKAVLHTARYRSAAFGKGYGAVRNRFGAYRSDYRSLTDQIKNSLPEQRGRGEAAERLLEALSYETVYQLSLIAPSAQLEMLSDTLSEEDSALLCDFCEQRGSKAFDIAAFQDWLCEIAVLESGCVQIRCGDVVACDDADLEYRAQICDGVQIRAGRRLYDYSMIESEIS